MLEEPHKCPWPHLSFASMAENGNGEQNGVPTKGTTFDQELYGASDRYAGFDTSIGLDVGDEQDERERALAKCVPKALGKTSLHSACL